MPNSPIPSSLIQSLGSAFGGSTTPAASPQPTPTPPPAGGPGVGSSLMDMFKNYGQNNDQTLQHIASMGNPEATPEDVENLKYAMNMGMTSGTVGKIGRSPGAGIADAIARHNAGTIAKMSAPGANPLVQQTSRYINPKSVEAAALRNNAKVTKP